MKKSALTNVRHIASVRSDDPETQSLAERFLQAEIRYARQLGATPQEIKRACR